MRASMRRLKTAWLASVGTPRHHTSMITQMITSPTQQLARREITAGGWEASGGPGVTRCYPIRAGNIVGNSNYYVINVSIGYNPTSVLQQDEKHFCSQNKLVVLDRIKYSFCYVKSFWSSIFQLNLSQTYLFVWYINMYTFSSGIWKPWWVYMTQLIYSTCKKGIDLISWNKAVTRCELYAQAPHQPRQCDLVVTITYKEHSTGRCGN